jgi:hypothetical protein
VRRLAVGKNKTGSNAVPSDAWTAVDAPGRIATGAVLTIESLGLGFVDDQQHRRRIMATFSAGI